MEIKEPVIQLALDFVDLPRALKVAEEAVAGGADWLRPELPHQKRGTLSSAGAP